MHARGHQEMPIIIRITIQDDDGIRRAIHDEVLAILAAGPAAAQETARPGSGAAAASWMYCARQGAQIRLNTMRHSCGDTGREALHPRIAAGGLSSPGSSRGLVQAQGWSDSISRRTILSPKGTHFRNGMSEPTVQGAVPSERVVAGNTTAVAAVVGTEHRPTSVLTDYPDQRPRQAQSKRRSQTG